MVSLYGKCVGITKNSEANNGTTDENCKWKSDNPNFKLATFGSETVGTFTNLSTLHCYNVGVKQKILFSFLISII